MKQAFLAGVQVTAFDTHKDSFKVILKLGESYFEHYEFCPGGGVPTEEVALARGLLMVQEKLQKHRELEDALIDQLASEGADHPAEVARFVCSSEGIVDSSG